jgi:Mrp family chromosome partitioning ATPase
MSSNGNGSHHNWWSFLRGRPRPAEAADRSPYRRLALQLHFELKGPKARRSVLLVTPVASPLSAQGSMTLAECLAEELRRPVLLIDASPRDRRVSRMLDCAASRGFCDLLSDPAILDEVLLPTSCENVYFLPAGTAFNVAEEVPDEFDAILKALESRYEFVLLSGGSVLNDSVALSLAPHVGRVLLLVVDNETMREDMEAANDILLHCKARNVGLVLTSRVRRKGARIAP